MIAIRRHRLGQRSHTAPAPPELERLGDTFQGTGSDNPDCLPSLGGFSTGARPAHFPSCHDDSLHFRRPHVKSTIPPVWCRDDAFFLLPTPHPCSGPGRLASGERAPRALRAVAPPRRRPRRSACGRHGRGSVVGFKSRCGNGRARSSPGRRGRHREPAGHRRTEGHCRTGSRYTRASLRAHPGRALRQTRMR